MKTRILFLIGFLLAQAFTSLSQTGSSVEQVLATIHSNDLVFLNATNALSTNNLAAAYDAYRHGKISKEALMLLIQRAANIESQDFYGKIVDQNGQPVSGVEIIGNLMVMGGLGDGATNQTFKTHSEPNGLFQFVGIKGWRLGVVVRKLGFAPGAIKGPNGEKTSVNDRQTFSLWKLQGAEPLEGIKGHYKLPYTNVPVNFDLLTGQIVQSGGDLRITINRPPGVISGRNRQDWSVQIEAVGGGLIDAAGQERVTYAAPENGYRPSVIVSASTNGHGVELIQEGVFLQSRNGQVYSKVGISFRINSEPDGLMYINFSGIANANGSRNWEGDPNTMNTAQ